MASDAHELVHSAQAGDDGPVFDGHVASELHDVGQNDIVSNVTVVREMDVRHQQTVSSHARLEGMRSAAIDRCVLTNHGPVADLDGGLLAGVLEILRRPTEDGPDADIDVLPKCDVTLERRSRGDDAAPSNRAVFARRVR